MWVHKGGYSAGDLPVWILGGPCCVGFGSIGIYHEVSGTNRHSCSLC